MFSQGSRQPLISLGNETFDQFLGGGFLNTSLNLFERQGPSSKLLDAVWNKSFASSTLQSKNNLILVNFNTSDDIQDGQYLSTLPVSRKVKTELLYKDVRGKSATAKIKIAWRYSSRNCLSPADKMAQTNQVDFGLHLNKEINSDELGIVKIINIKHENYSLKTLLIQLEKEVSDLKCDQIQAKSINIIIKDLLHPLSPVVDKTSHLMELLFMLRCFARTLGRGAILVTYDTDMCLNHFTIKQNLYNMADCVVSFFSYETGQNVLLGYKHTDGTLDYVKVPKINSFGLHFQRELSDWGYRFTRNHRFFVVDELNLPPCHDDEDDGGGVRKQITSEVTDIDYKGKRLEQVGPLEEFREVAGYVLAKKT